MFLGLRVEVRGGETEVYYVYLVCLEEVFFTGFELVGVDSKIKEEVIELEVVVDEAGIVYLLEDVEHLQSEGVDLSAGELHFSTKE
jgi:hypothetical protein